MAAAERTREPVGVATAAESLQERPLTLRSRSWRQFRRHRLAMAGLAFLVVLVLLGLLAPLVAGQSPSKTNLGESLSAPSAAHLLGTDQVGRDVWSRLIHAIRVSLSVGLVAVSISVLISLVLGSLAGYYGGIVDLAIMRVTDIVMCFPSLVIILTVVAIVGPSIITVMAVIGLLSWPGTTRLVRGQILSVREVDYVTAARCVGASNRRIMTVHILPNVVAPLVVAASFGVAAAILTEASLSFLGLGVLPPTPSWGNMLAQARSISIMENHLTLWVAPGLMVLLTVLAINFIGDGLRDALDPRMSRH